jgi:hypothetical protein
MTPILTASENPITVALNYDKTVNLSGGKGSYNIKSISDSTIVSLNIYSQIQGASPSSGYVHFIGKKLGTTKVIIQDSAKTAEVEIIVTVSVLASSPSAITVRTQQTKYASITGGVYPYKISQPANAAIATVTVGTSVMIVGVSPGSTSVTISDNSNPPNSVTIPITVTIPPSLTTSGKISFNTTKGNFQTEGIYSDIFSQNVPSNDAGAGGVVTKYSTSGNIGQIIGYKKKTATLIDVVVMLFFRYSFAPGKVLLDTAGSTNINREFGSIMFGFDLVPYGQTNTMYSTFSGDMTFSTYNEQKAEGTFQGNAGLLSSQTGDLVPGNNVTFSQGVFSVPLIVEDGTMMMSTKADQAIFNQIEEIIKPQIDRMKEQIELRYKPKK